MHSPATQEAPLTLAELAARNDRLLRQLETVRNERDGLKERVDMLKIHISVGAPVRQTSLENKRLREQLAATTTKLTVARSELTRLNAGDQTQTERELNDLRYRHSLLRQDFDNLTAVRLAELTLRPASAEKVVRQKLLAANSELAAARTNWKKMESDLSMARNELKMITLSRDFLRARGRNAISFIGCVGARPRFQLFQREVAGLDDAARDALCFALMDEFEQKKKTRSAA